MRAYEQIAGGVKGVFARGVFVSQVARDTQNLSLYVIGLAIVTKTSSATRDETMGVTCRRILTMGRTVMAVWKGA